MNYILEERDSRAINTLSAKLELYVGEKEWKNADRESQEYLNAFINYASERLEKLSINMMNIRFKLIQERDIDSINKQLENVRVIVGGNCEEECGLEGDISE